MAETLLDKISKHPNNTIVSDAWLTGQTGEIVDLQGNCVFRFIDYIDSPELRLKHTTEESQLSCPIVACGIVGYWLHKKDIEGTKAIFDGYYELRLREYEKAHESDDDAWERDFKKEFVCRYHISNEKKKIKTSEALFAYITESDQKRIKSITDNYLKFARAKRKESYPPNHPASRIIEDTFLDAYRMGGPAYECMSWMRTEYNLPNMGPHWHISRKTEKEQLSGKWKEYHERVIPEFVAEGYEDFNDRVLKYSNGGLMDEIDDNIKKCQTREDRIRYIISLLQPFKEFAEAFDAKAQIDERKRSIAEHEKWIKDWESMPDDAVDERTGEPLRPKDQISACKESIEEYNQDIEYWKKVQKDFYWFAQHGLGAGHYREYPQEVNDEMCKYLGGWWECMIFFARRLAALALTYGIKLMDVQERCEVYLMWHFMITDYIDNKYITSTEHARRLLDEIDAKKPKSEAISNTGISTNEESKEADTTKVKAVAEEATQKTDSDFEHLKNWKDNPDLDYYLSEHWNHDVNHLLYTYLKNRYKGNEVGIYINLVLLKGSKSFQIDYNNIYGVMFNEAYSFCSYVLNTKVPETKIHQLEKSAAGLCNIESAAPIISYHILVMTGMILCFANDRNDTVGKFLSYLSFHNSSHYFGDEFHHFENYIRIGLEAVAAIMIDSRLQPPGKLRPGYDYKSQDEYLRKEIPWYRISAEKLEERVKEAEKKKNNSEDIKPTKIIEQKYYDSNVYNAPVTINNYIQTEATSSEGSPEVSHRKKGCVGKQTGRADNIVKEQEKEHGLPYPVFKIVGKTSSANVKALGSYLINVRGWIRIETRNPNYPIANEIEEWTRLFNGEDNNSEFIFTGQDQLGKNNPRMIGVANLYYLFRCMVENRLIEGNVGPIIESHFTDIDGHFLQGVNKNAKASKFADSIIKKALSYMSAQLTDEMVDNMLIEELINEERNREGERGKIKNNNKQNNY